MAQPPSTTRPRLKCIITAPRGPEYDDVRRAILSAAKDSNIRVLPRNAGLLLELENNTVSEILQSDLVVAVLGSSPSVYYEIGLAQAMGKPIISLVEEEVRTPDFFSRFDQPIVSYDRSTAGLRRLHLSLRKLFEDVILNPRRFRMIAQQAARSALPEIDFGALHPRELENLCFELLTQMGYRRVEWGKQLDEIDVVATLPKKDPDGFEYDELWLISMGLRRPSNILLDIVASDPGFLLKRLRRPGLKEAARTRDAPITLLFISFRDDVSSESFQDHLRRLELRQSESRLATPLRVRLWERRHLTSLIRQHPQIALKYFSEDQRSHTPSRKSYEELYRDNSALSKQYAQTITILKDERDRRVRAERDAAWKDVAFTAAHKLGNPVFALETNLQGLKRKLLDRPLEAVEITDEMNISIEKAKAIIEQFKSLTKSQNITTRAVDLLPIIQAAASVAKANGVQVDIVDDAKGKQIQADPIRIAECFDELFANSLHWLKKPAKNITIRIDIPDARAVPPAIDNAFKYVRVSFADNGDGIPADKKEAIFAPFYSTYPHGTGLGLALVQRLIEAHSGTIREVGSHGESAVFEIFLPQTALPKQGK
jgi:signal transduction histidine kinase